jgi:hypothetical protein
VFLLTGSPSFGGSKCVLKKMVTPAGLDNGFGAHLLFAPLASPPLLLILVCLCNTLVGFDRPRRRVCGESDRALYLCRCRKDFLKSGTVYWICGPMSDSLYVSFIS